MDVGDSPERRSASPRADGGEPEEIGRIGQAAKIAFDLTIKAKSRPVGPQPPPGPPPGWQPPAKQPPVAPPKQPPVPPATSLVVEPYIQPATKEVEDLTEVLKVLNVHTVPN